MRRDGCRLAPALVAVVMAARDQAPSLATQKREAAERHNRVLLHAWQTATPVVFNGLNQFLHTLKFMGDGEVEVFLAGDPTPHRPDEVQLSKLIDQPQTAPSAPGAKL